MPSLDVGGDQGVEEVVDFQQSPVEGPEDQGADRSGLVREGDGDDPGPEIPPSTPGSPMTTEMSPADYSPTEPASPPEVRLRTTEDHRVMFDDAMDPIGAEDDEATGDEPMVIPDVRAQSNSPPRPSRRRLRPLREESMDDDSSKSPEVDRPSGPKSARITDEAMNQYRKN